MANPFDDPGGTFLALVNDEGQHSLWPAFVDVPNGWTVVHPADTRETCLDHIEKNWTDLRPAGLVAELGEHAKATAGSAAP